MSFLQATQESAIKLLENASDQKGSQFIMLNLLRLKPQADYSLTNLPNDQHCNSAEQALDRYVKETLPYLKKSGGTLLLLADAKNYFIGPENESWDKVMLIQQNSVSDFFAFAQNQDYADVLAHRQAAIEDSRLLPLWPCAIKP